MAANASRILQKLYLIGDSNTQQAFCDNGFASRLADEYIRKCDVVNRGYSGYTSRHLKVMLPTLLAEANTSIHVATLLIGSNDAVPEQEDDRHVPLDEYRTNIENMLTQLKNSNIKYIFLLSPPPLNGPAWAEKCLTTKNITTTFSTDHVAPYASICKELACKHDVKHIDLYNDMLKFPDWKDYFYDGLHFSDKGNSYVFTRLKEHFDSIFEDVEMAYPDWKTLSATNYLEHLT